MIRLYFGKILYRFYSSLEKLAENFIMKLVLLQIRIEAHRQRKVVVKRKGKSVLNRHVKRTIKEYAKQRFGKTAYWPYLALYTEIRGEFIKGWLPYDYYRFVLLPKINPKPSMYLSTQKTYDYRLFGEFAIRPLFIFVSGMFFNTTMEIVEKSRVKKFFSDYNDIIVVKEDSGYGGKQVRIIPSAAFIIEELQTDKNYIIQPYIKQYKILNDLYPESVNDFRVLTYLKTDGSVTVIFVALRFGADGLKVDNVTSGGSCLYFDLNGNPSKTSYDDLGFPLSDKHKNTGFLFSNITIPTFQVMLEKCKNAHKKYPYTRLIGWDVCIDSSGDPKLLEWNTNNMEFSSFDAKFGPLWPDDNEDTFLNQ
jgi:Sugar-transfer associated ATP-grasp